MSIIPLRPLVAALPDHIAVLRQAQDDRVDVWLSAQQIAEARLPGMPKNKRNVNELAAREKWAFRCAPDGTELTRTRKGRGGGLEYHIDLLPPAARAKAMEKFKPASVCANGGEDAGGADNDERSAIWSWFDQQNEDTKVKAGRNLTVVCEVERLISTGHTASAAVAHCAARFEVGRSTIESWRAAVRGIAHADWLPYLAPRYKGGGKASDIDGELFRYYCSLLLTNNKRTHALAYRMVKAKAQEIGASLPSYRTMQRRYLKEVDPMVAIRAREGSDAFEATLPPQIRSVADLYAMRLLNIDGHQWDVWVNWPGLDKPVRPMMVAIQDVYSNLITSWRVDLSENVAVTRLAFADTFKKYGLPEAVLMDNSRTFASKKLTEGAATRFRGKVKDEAPHGILPLLSINIHWALPYHGQAKKIERAFNDFCRDIARGALEFEGAWTGNHIDNKPDNYRSKAVDLDTFLAVVDRGIKEYNAREGRRTEMCKDRGISFEQCFAESYARHPVTKPTEEQLRLALLSTATHVSTNRKNGSFKLFGNVYWSEDMPYVAGDKIIVRYDPDNLHDEVHVYDMDNRFIATVGAWLAVGVLDEEAARILAKRRANWRKKEREAREAHDAMTVQEMLAYQAAPIDAPFEPEAKVVRPLRTRGNTALKPVLDAVQPPLNAPAKPSAMERMAAAHAKLKLVE